MWLITAAAETKDLPAVSQVQFDVTVYKDKWAAGNDLLVKSKIHFDFTLDGTDFEEFTWGYVAKSTSCNTKCKCNTPKCCTCSRFQWTQLY